MTQCLINWSYLTVIVNKNQNVISNTVALFPKSILTLVQIAGLVGLNLGYPENPARKPRKPS